VKRLEQGPKPYWPEALTDLNISSGTAMQIEQVGSKQRLKSEWLGSIGQQHVYIRAPKGAPRLVLGTRLRVRMLQDNWVCAFEAEIYAHIDKPEPLWVLKYPSTFEVARLRQDHRLPVAIRVRVDGAYPLVGPERVNALMTDLHLRGAALESHLSLGEVGDQIFITTRLDFADTEHLVMLAAEIVNQGDTPEDSLYTEHYGVRFEPMDDETRVYLRGYLAELRLSHLGYELNANPD